MKDIVILKVGGSILSPSPETLFSFEAANKIIEALKPLTNDYKFILSCGGGHLARKYQSFVKDQNKSNREIDWAGTEACNMNAVMMRIALSDLAEDQPILATAVDSDESFKFEKDFLTVGAAAPGHSSDLDATLMAKRTGAKKIISLKNVDGVYSDDPNTNPDAKKYENLSWEEYKTILGTEEFTPKMSVPVDPVATSQAIDMGLTFVILNGNDTENLANAIECKDFIGTTISN